jgi:alpha-amylase/alpha-mannosidase (GH57 family)
MSRFICIHGHFYQPPRESPWLEAVELQDSAAPYHDWNERIAAECYAPNAFARLLDEDGRITEIVSNYSRISFNFGPTLLAWMQEKAPDVLTAIVQADQESRERFSGHGSALAQCYNHMIMPLAHPRDKVTQVRWGLRDFEARFGRPAEGMWLPECAVDLDTLEVLAAHGIRFTILSPFQAGAVRPLGENGEDWQDVDGGRVDPSRPYAVRLPSGGEIAVFFYDAPVSQAVAFERLLHDGDRFAGRLLDGYDEDREGDQLVHIATDGESYGHHHRQGEMALAYALHRIESEGLARLTNYGEFLEKHPPQWEARLHAPSAWSCCHGVDRWIKHCGCNSGGRAGWNQHWRQPLRHALDWLRDQLAPLYEERAREFLRDPWEARDEYISLLLDRSPENRAAYFKCHGRDGLTPEGQITATRLLELQRHAMLMFTSCGWFFDELSGIETVQVIQYAARAIQLAADLLGEDLEPRFLSLLEKARSNIRDFGNGGRIYANFVKPGIMDRERVGAHYAVSSLFESYPETAKIYSYTVEQEDRQVFIVGNARLALGRARVRFEVTQNSDVISYGVLHLGDHNLNCGVRHYQGPEAYAELVRQMREAFERADFPGVIRLMDRDFGESNYSLKNLFRDEQRRVLDQILAATREDIHNTYRQISDRYAPLLRFLADIHAPAPPALRLAHEFVVNTELRRQFDAEVLDVERIQTMLREIETRHVVLDRETLAYAFKAHLDKLVDRWRGEPEDPEVVRQFAAAAELLELLPFEVKLWRPQNVYFIVKGSTFPDVNKRAAAGDKAAQLWVEQFRVLGEQLGFRMETVA